MVSFALPLPIDAALPELTATLAERTTAVLVAPPGAGKTTRVPLALAAEPWAREKKILVLEPRRLAARAAAEFMAKSLGEAVGDTVGYRVRFGTKVSRRTRIEVVTEGVFTGLILDDPSLDGIGAVLFDEFHERSLDADLGLALARDAQQGLREDLRLVVMSATIDGARIAKALGDAPVIASEGRAFPVETRYLGRDPGKPIEAAVADAVLRALRAEPGSILAFLPGAAEIRRAETFVKERVTDPAVDVVTLFGALDAAVQDRAIAPAPAGRRKVVLATSIAETSITIEGVRAVIDSGLARVPRYEPDVGVTRLETVRVSRAAADQRRGRAGRTEPGACYRLWDEPQTASLEAFAQPEILAADLSSFVLDLAQWGVSDPGTLVFLDPPPAAALSEARTLLADLGAIDTAGRITAEGKLLNRMPLPPRLARMVVDAGREGAGRRAAEIAAIISERSLGGTDVDLRHRLDALARDRAPRAEEARRMARRWAEVAAASSTSPSRGRSGGGPGGGDSGATISSIASVAPSPHGEQKGTAFGGPTLPSRGGCGVDGRDPCARLSGAHRQEPRRGDRRVPARQWPRRRGRSGLAARARALSRGRRACRQRGAEPDHARRRNRPRRHRSAVRGPHRHSRGDHLRSENARVARSALAAARRNRARRTTAAGRSERSSRNNPRRAIVKAGLDRLPWTKALAQWRDRVAFLRRAEGEEWPDLSDAGLASSAAAWLVPLLFGKTALAQVTAAEFEAALHALLPHALRRRLDAEAPTHFDAPSGSHVPIDYTAEEGPKLAIRVQELFGLNRHPTIAGGRMPSSSSCCRRRTVRCR